MKQENVLVFRTDLLHEIGYFQGLCRAPDPYHAGIIAGGNTLFMDRETAETDPRFKQLIPYVLIGAHGRLFSYARGKRMSEDRLRNQWSIGIGGHVNDRDPALLCPEENFLYAMKREVHEETIITCGSTVRLVGAVNDDHDEVGKVHFGLVYYMELERDCVTKREQSVTKAELRTWDELRASVDKYENWSAWCIKNLPDMLD